MKISKIEELTELKEIIGDREVEEALKEIKTLIKE